MVQLTSEKDDEEVNCNVHGELLDPNGNPNHKALKVEETLSPFKPQVRLHKNKEFNRGFDFG